MPGWDGYREVFSISQAGFVPDKELSLKSAFALQEWQLGQPKGSFWTSLLFFQVPSELPPICGASDSDEMTVYWRVYLDASELFKAMFYEPWFQICF